MVRQLLAGVREEGRPLRSLCGVLPHQRAVAPVRGGAARVRRALRRGRRRALLRPGRGEGRARLRAAGAQPGGPGGAAPHREQAGARHRQAAPSSAPRSWPGSAGCRCSKRCGRSPPARRGAIAPRRSCAAFSSCMRSSRASCPAARPVRRSRCVLERSGYLRKLEQEGGSEAEARIENLRELVAAAEDFGRANAGATMSAPRSSSSSTRSRSSPISTPTTAATTASR